jgi:hypothetical protein
MLHVDRGPQIVRNPVLPSIDAGALVARSNTAAIAPQSCACGSCGKRFPVAFWTFALYFATSASKSFAVSSVSSFTFRAFLAAVRMCSNSAFGTSSTTSEYI